MGISLPTGIPSAALVVELQREQEEKAQPHFCPPCGGNLDGET